MPIRILVTVILAVLLTGCPPPRGVYHKVREGQTLYRISKTYKVDERYLARLNSIDDPTRLRVGQRLFIPGADRVKTVPSTAVSKPATPPAVIGKARSSPPKKTADTRPASRSQAAASGSRRTSTSKPPATAKGRFVWPLKGKILKKFTAKGGAPSKGVEIAARRGTPVLSAAAGKVIFSGDGISGYGNLVILKHDDSFFTVYGFNEKNLVDAGAFVSKEERIALSGAPPGGGSPRLHFEIRYGKKAVNPIFYLP